MGRRWNWRPIIAATPRSRTPYAIKYGVGLNHMPSARFAANGAWLAVQVMHKTARIGLDEGTLQRTRSARPHFASPPALALGFSRALARLQAIPFPA